MKIKYKNILILLVVISLVVGGFIYFNKSNDSNKKANNKSDTSKYSTKSIKQIEKLKIKNKIDLNKYSKTLDVAIFSDEYNYNYITYYENTKYFDNDNLISYINKLAKDGYAIGEINELFDNFLSYSNFDINNAKRYTAYKAKNPDLNKQDVVTRVNLNLDKPFYSEAKRVEKQDDMYALVNKYNYVDISYVPSNLKTLFNNSNIKMVDVAADAYKEFVDAAKNDGITFIGTTAYRSGSFQKQLYDSYVAKDGVEKADTYSARPGYSEHQLGYSVDLNDPNYKEKRISPSDYEWIKNNAYKYGFIIRFPANKENITGYQEEDWHIRYVGKNVAKKIHELNITFEEYYDLYIAKH